MKSFGARNFHFIPSRPGNAINYLKKAHMNIIILTMINMNMNNEAIIRINPNNPPTPFKF